MSLQGFGDKRKRTRERRQSLDEMKASIYMIASLTGTTVRKGDKVLIHGR